MSDQLTRAADPVADTRPPDEQATAPPASAGDWPTVPAYSASADAVAPPGYELLSVLGRGGMGVVYLARQVRLNREVALKMVAAAEPADAMALVRFLAEAEAVAAISHPNVVGVYEFGDAAGRPFLAMEYVPGGTLADHLRATGRLTPLAAAALVERIARGVQAAHDVGIVHRDLKPANILLEAARDAAAGSRPKITDFGLAKKGLGADLTRTQAFMGTPAYMAPEQARGEAKFVGPAADIYAVGVILYESLTGTRPFDAPDPLSLLRKITDEEPPPLRSRSADVPRELELVCLKCLAKNPRDRYPAAATLADDLANYLRGDPVSVSPPSAWFYVRRFVRRNRAAVATAAGLFVVLAVVVAAWRATADARAQAAAETRVANAVNAALNASGWEPAALDALAPDLAALEAASPAAATDARRRIAERLAVYAEAVLTQKLRPDAADLRKIDAAIERLAALDPEQAEAVRARRHARMTDWQPVAALAPPFADATAVFRHKGKVNVAGDRLTWTPDDPRFGGVQTTIPFGLRSQVEATFHADLKPGQSIGLGLESIEEPDTPRAIAHSPTVSLLAVGHQSGRVAVRDPRTGSPPVVLHEGGAVVSALAFAPDGAELIAGFADGAVKVWAVNDRKVVFAGNAFGKAVHSVAIHPDGRWLAAGTAAGHVAAFDRTAPAAPRKVAELHSIDPASVAFSHDGQRLFVAAHTSVECYRFGMSERVWRSTGNSNSVTDLQVTADGRGVFTITTGGQIVVLDATSGAMRGQHNKGDLKTAIAHHPKRPQVLVASDTGRISTIDAAAFEAVALGPANALIVRDRIDGWFDRPVRIAFAGDGARVYVLSAFGAVVGYELATGAAAPVVRNAVLRFYVHGDAGSDGMPRHVVQVRRGSAPIQSKVIPATGAVYKLAVSREGNALVFRVNDAHDLEFTDTLPFPPPPGVVAVYGTGGFTLTSLTATARAAAAAQPLDRADELLNRGDLPAALAEFRLAAANADQTRMRREAECKAGLCLERKQRWDEALALYEPLAADPAARDDEWGVLAAARAVGLYHHRGNRGRATEATTQLVARVAASPDILRRTLAHPDAAELVRHVETTHTEHGQPFPAPDAIRLLQAELFLRRTFDFGSRVNVLTRRFMSARLLGSPDAPAFARELLAAYPRWADYWPDRTIWIGYVHTWEEFGCVARLTGDKAVAAAVLADLDRMLFGPMGLPLYPMTKSRWLHVERARLQIHLDDRVAARRSLGPLLAPARPDIDYPEFAAARLIVGCLAADAGDEAAARAAWATATHDNFIRGRHPAPPRADRETHAPFMLMTRGLAGGPVTAAEAGFDGPPVPPLPPEFAPSADLIRASTPGIKFTALPWHSAVGRDVARAHAYRTLTHYELKRKLFALGVYAAVLRDTGHAPPTPTADRELFADVERIIPWAVTDGRAGPRLAPELLQAWAGDAAAWAAVRNRIPTDLRPACERILALRLRYVGVNPRETAPRPR